MGVLMFPRMFRPRRGAGDDISRAFGECCSALNRLSPKSRDMVSRWIQERYAAQLEEDLHPIEDDPAQTDRDRRYVENITSER